MKAIYYICLVGLLLAGTQAGFSQEQTQRRPARQRPSEAAATENTPALTERARIKNQEESKTPGHVPWLREIYRNIDLKKANNGALYYPTQPIGNRVNLFTLLFKLLADGKITAYNYVGEREVFTDDQKLDFERDILKKYQILYVAQNAGNNKRYIVEDGDIPSEEVTMYMVKEGWYFDEASGSFKSQIIAICPLMVREDYYYGGTSNNPLFWVPYEEIRPYLSRELVMTSDYNNALTYTMDDFFAQKMYSGDIIKTTNMMNQSLAQQVGDNPEVLKHAQDSIENQLKTFRRKLWVDNDTIAASSSQKVKDQKDPEKAKATTKKTSGRGSSSSSKAKASSGSSKTPKAEKSSAPTKSVRRTRR